MASLLIDKLLNLQQARPHRDAQINVGSPFAKDKWEGRDLDSLNSRARKHLYKTNEQQKQILKPSQYVFFI